MSARDTTMNVTVDVAPQATTTTPVASTTSGQDDATVGTSAGVTSAVIFVVVFVAVIVIRKKVQVMLSNAKPYNRCTIGANRLSKNNQHSLKKIGLQPW